jgi:hypothetical protein
MKIKINKDAFVDYLVGPASKIADNLLLTTTTNNGEQFLKTLTYSSDNSVILQTKIPYSGDNIEKLFIPEVKTFIRLLANLNEETLSFEIGSNFISYNGKDLNFKYHLLDEAFFSNKKTISEEKINSITYDTTFTTTKNKFSDLLKYNSIIPDAEKLYFIQKSNSIIGKLGDDQKPNINEIETELASIIEGKKLEQSMPVSIQSIIMLTFFQNHSVVVRLNQELKIFKFECGPVEYIISGLVK